MGKISCKKQSYLLNELLLFKLGLSSGPSAKMSFELNCQCNSLGSFAGATALYLKSI